jgi:hypothetical protein
LIEGEPSTSFPSSLYSIRRQTGLGSVGSVDHSVEPLAADFRLLNGLGKSSTWRIAKLKLLSTILGCRFDDLMMREQARRRRQLIAAFGGLVGVLILISTFAVIAVVQRGIARTERADAIVQRDAALLTQSRFLTDLSRQQTTSGNTSLGMLLALEALPRDFSARDRPYLPQAMAGLYSAVVAHREVLTVKLSESADVDPEKSPMLDEKLSSDGSLLLVGTESGSVQLWDVAKRAKIGERRIGSEPIRVAQFGHRSSAIEAQRVGLRPAKMSISPILSPVAARRSSVKTQRSWTCASMTGPRGSSR